jgi:uroporphyrinogen-III synthase
VRVWITRARPEAEATAARIAALGWTPLIAPLLEIRPLPAPLELEGVGALAFSSRNGVRALAAAPHGGTSPPTPWAAPPPRPRGRRASPMFAPQRAT